jgi:heptosyltransferase-1
VKILIIKTSSMGDIIHCLPVIADIRMHFPDTRIDWVVEDSFIDIPHMHSGINQVTPVAIRHWRKNLFNKKTWNEISAFKHSLAKYDAVIDCQGLTKSALIACLANGTRHGFDWHSGRDPFASVFYAKKHTVSLMQDAVARNRELVALALGYAVPTDAPDYGISTKSDASMNRMDIGLQGGYIIALHGTSRDSKLWPVLSWVTLGKALAEKNLNLLLPWASDVELQRANEIASQLSNAKALPKLGLAQLAPIISHAQAAIGVDTGLTHLAVALNIPTIAIYTDSRPALNGVIAGAGAHAVNLGDIGQVPSVEEVLQAFNQL